MRPRGDLALGLCLTLSFGACFVGDFVQGLPCASDADCGPELRCSEGVCGGRGDPALCGNGLLDVGELCDDGNTHNGDGCSASCDLCGNGITEPEEECDDGNTAAGDSCTPACRFPVCGDGLLAPGEECDDGNEIGTDDCTPACTPPACGDGFVNVEGEECDDGNAVETDDCTTACTESPEAPMLELTLAQVKQFQFGWEPALGAAYYQLFERADVDADFVQVGGDIVGESFSLTVPLHFRPSASYELLACNALDTCKESEVVDVEAGLVEAIGYFKASNTDSQDSFGSSVAISDDGSTLAVGAFGEDGNGMDEGDDSAENAGAVYVFVRDGKTWRQQAYVKASAAGTQDFFGRSVALSADGSTLAVGAPGWFVEPAAYVFVRRGERWSQQASLRNPAAGPFVAASVALSADGDTLAVSAHRDSSGAMGSDVPAPDSGAVQVFVRNDESWSPSAYLKASNPGSGDNFGYALSLSGDGRTLAVGAPYEDSAATDVDSDGEDDDSFANAGAVYVFVRDEDRSWSQQAYVKASNTGAWDGLGTSVALSDDGNTLAVGAPGEDSAATGIDGWQGDDFPPSVAPIAELGAGATYVFVRDSGSWSQQAYVKASNTGDLDLFGTSVALSSDGNTMAVGAIREGGAAVGVGGEQNDLQGESGAIYVFVRDGTQWSQRSYVKEPVPFPRFGKIVALQGDASTLVAGNSEESGATAGVGNVPNDDSYQNAGAVFLY